MVAPNFHFAPATGFRPAVERGLGVQGSGVRSLFGGLGGTCVADLENHALTTAYCSKRSEANCPLPASTPRATGRSNEGACFGKSPGARLITTRSWGRMKPLLTIARSTRCVLSLTAASGKPTRIVLGIAAGERSTSTSTGIASMPNNVNVFSRANMPSAPLRILHMQMVTCPDIARNPWDGPPGPLTDRLTAWKDRPTRAVYAVGEWQKNGW